MSKRPIIFIGENVYSYGLKAFRKTALIFRLFKNHEQVCKKVGQIVHEERLGISNDLVAKICSQHDDHLGSILRFLDWIRKGKLSQRQDIEAQLEKQNRDKKEENVLTVMRLLFDKSSRRRALYDSRIT